MKSPPELWAEVSDPAVLARHLGEIASAIRITRIEPERSVAWEGDGASGRVELAPTGWGTKVKLTLRAEAPVGEPPAAETETPAPEPDAEARAPVVEPQPPVVEVEATPPADLEDDATLGGAEADLTAAEPDLTAAGHTSPPEFESAETQVWDAVPPPTEPARGGLLARLFSRLSGRPRAERDPGPGAPAPPSAAPMGSADKPSPTAFTDGTYGGIGRPAPAPAPDPPGEAAHLEPPGREPLPEAQAQPGPHPLPDPESEPDPEPDPEAPEPSPIAAETKTTAVDTPADEGLPTAGPDQASLARERATATLAAMLDSLGAAHHRPFSRS